MEPPDREALLTSFRSVFITTSPVYFVRAPGRINLIGEHTDYNGFPVMPLAIDRAIRAVFSPRDDRFVSIRNVADKYSPRKFRIKRRIPRHPQGDWVNYVKAGVQGIISRLQERRDKLLPDLRGFDCLFDGNIPPAAGLSSSSALVVASALAFCAVNELKVLRRELATLMAESEHYVGTRGGGMDQAICLLGQKDHVLKIDFFPLRTAPAPLPPDYSILAAHSTVPAAKTQAQMQAYNRRVLECRLGTTLLGRATGNPDVVRLADLVDEPTGWTPTKLVDQLSDMLDGSRTVTLARVAALLDTGEDELRHWLRSETALEEAPQSSECLKILPRCRHVFSEARRVEEAFQKLRAGDAEAVGRLLDRSHRSCAEDYEISCPELDRLTAMMRDAGAAGARLTGAGFGGFAIGLVRERDVPAVTDVLSRGFYGPRGLEPSDYVFEFTPQDGASVTPVNQM